MFFEEIPIGSHSEANIPSKPSNINELINGVVAQINDRSPINGCDGKGDRNLKILSPQTAELIKPGQTVHVNWNNFQADNVSGGYAKADLYDLKVYLNEVHYKTITYTDDDPTSVNGFPQSFSDITFPCDSSKLEPAIIKFEVYAYENVYGDGNSSDDNHRDVLKCKSTLFAVLLPVILPPKPYLQLLCDKRNYAYVTVPNPQNVDLLEMHFNSVYNTFDWSTSQKNDDGDFYFYAKLGADTSIIRFMELRDTLNINCNKSFIRAPFILTGLPSEELEFNIAEIDTIKQLLNEDDFYPFSINTDDIIQIMDQVERSLYINSNGNVNYSFNFSATPKYKGRGDECEESENNCVSKKTIDGKEINVIGWDDLPDYKGSCRTYDLSVDVYMGFMMLCPATSETCFRTSANCSIEIPQQQTVCKLMEIPPPLINKSCDSLESISLDLNGYDQIRWARKTSPDEKIYMGENNPNVNYNYREVLDEFKKFGFSYNDFMASEETKKDYFLVTRYIAKNGRKGPVSTYEVIIVPDPHEVEPKLKVTHKEFVSPPLPGTPACNQIDADTRSYFDLTGHQDEAKDAIEEINRYFEDLSDALGVNSIELKGESYEIKWTPQNHITKVYPTSDQSNYLQRVCYNNLPKEPDSNGNHCRTYEALLIIDAGIYEKDANGNKILIDSVYCEQLLFTVEVCRGEDVIGLPCAAPTPDPTDYDDCTVTDPNLYAICPSDTLEIGPEPKLISTYLWDEDYAFTHGTRNSAKVGIDQNTIYSYNGAWKVLKVVETTLEGIGETYCYSTYSCDDCGNPPEPDCDTVYYCKSDEEQPVVNGTYVLPNGRCVKYVEKQPDECGISCVPNSVCYNNRKEIGIVPDASTSAYDYKYEWSPKIGLSHPFNAKTFVDGRVLKQNGIRDIKYTLKRYMITGTGEETPKEEIHCENISVNYTCDYDKTDELYPTVKPIEWRIYPQPAKSNVIIDYGETKPSKISIFDVRGVLIYEVLPEPDELNTKINTSIWSPGIYYVRLENNLGEVQIKPLSIIK